MEKSQGSIKLQIDVPLGLMNLISDLLKFGNQTVTPREFIKEHVAQIGEDILNDLSIGTFNHEDLRRRYGLNCEPKDAE